MFKFLLISLLAITVSACSSNKTKEESDKVTKKATTKAKKMVKKTKSKLKSKASSSATASAGAVVCTHQDDKRSISNIKIEGGGCEVQYVKNGETKIVATAASDQNYCTEVANRISGNLENAGYTCK